MNFAERLKLFREQTGRSQYELASLLGVSKITILRWENSTSKPSPLAAEKLMQLGFGQIDSSETKIASVPRLSLIQGEDLRDGLRAKLKIGSIEYVFNPAPYVINGPADQIPFFEILYDLQSIDELPCPINEYASKLSSIAELPLLTLETSQYLLEKPKPTAKHWNPNYGPHGWHRYVGRFPPHLIRAVINNFSLVRHATLYDPFAGSGTALVEGRLLGLRSIGVEISPLSAMISRTKCLFPTNTQPLEKIIEDLGSYYHSKWNEFLGNREPSRITHRAILGRAGNPIREFPNIEKWMISEALLGTSIVVEFAQTLEGYQRDFVCCALSSRMRSIGNVDVDVVRAEYSSRPRHDVDVLKLVISSLRRVINDINNTLASHPYISSPEDIQIIQSSLLETDLEDNSVDCIITSPPYGVESLSYLRTHLLSYRCLGSILGIDPYEKNEKVIGSEYLSNKEIDVSNLIVEQMSKTFQSFFAGSVIADQSTQYRNRRNMMMHFFEQMVHVANHFHKVLRNHGKVAFVIGNKKLGNFQIPTDKIIIDIFASAGLVHEKSIPQKLKCNNSNSEVPWQERTIQDEYILLFSNHK